MSTYALFQEEMGEFRRWNHISVELAIQNASGKLLVLRYQLISHTRRRWRTNVGGCSQGDCKDRLQLQSYDLMGEMRPAWVGTYIFLMFWVSAVNLTSILLRAAFERALARIELLNAPSRSSRAAITPEISSLYASE